MDADKRHQLKSNELAEALAKLRNFSSDPQTRIWLGVLAVLIIVVVGYRVWTHRQTQQLIDGWQELARVGLAEQTNPATTTAELQALLGNASNQALAAGARIRLAATLRQQAAEDPANHDALISRSVTELKRIIDDPEVPASIVAAAAFSLGNSYESLRQFEQAAKMYELLSDEARFPGSPFVELAANRLDTLNELPTKSPFEPGLPPAPPSAEPAQTQPTTAPSRPLTAATQPAAEPPTTRPTSPEAVAPTEPLPEQPAGAQTP